MTISLYITEGKKGSIVTLSLYITRVRKNHFKLEMFSMYCTSVIATVATLAGPVQEMITEF